MPTRTEYLIIAATLAVPALVVLSLFSSTHQRMNRYREQITPDMSVESLTSFAGQPNVVLRRGESLNRARRSYTIPPLDEHTAIYFYPKEGFPYYNVYVFVDERHRAVIRSDIENLWW
jgi:hypothetical protein